MGTGRTVKACVFEEFCVLEMAARLCSPWGVELAYEGTGPVTRGQLCEVR